MLTTIRDAWGWLNINPVAIEAENEFGCVIFLDAYGSRWLIRTDEPSCEVIAQTDSEYKKLSEDDEFLLDWKMPGIVKAAKQYLGKNEAEQCYCLKIPCFLGGKYELENMGTISRKELVAFAGDLARQIRDVPDGSKIILDWTE
ncbi:MAG: T6SS immunity protein Tdi1 domain-containing protein [Planctomycetota bacterium]